MKPGYFLYVALLVVAACAQTTIQPMSKDSFKVATQAAPACGPNGARNVAFKSASIEVISRGYDKFVLVGDANNSDFWTGAHKQDMVVRVIAEGSPEAANALSAREQLARDPGKRGTHNLRITGCRPPRLGQSHRGCAEGMMPGLKSGASSATLAALKLRRCSASVPVDAAED